MKKICSLIIVICVFSNASIHAGGIADMMNFVSQEGTMMNDTPGSIVKDQSGGFVSGGSTIIRGPRPKTLQPIRIQTPKFKYDPCTGSADFRFGALSYISAEEFVEFFIGMAKAVGPYAAKMILKTHCPQCEDILTYMETVSRDINNMMLDQCAMAQSIGEGLVSKLTSSQQQKCLTNAGESGNSPDFYEANKECKKNKSKYPDKESVKRTLGDNFNLVWHSFKEDKNSGFDQDFLELVMSIAGTLIGEKKDDSFTFRHYPSLFDQNNIENLIGGGDPKGGAEIRIYRCQDSDKCLVLTEERKKLNSQDTIFGKVSNIIEKKLIDHVAKDVPEDQLSSEEHLLINYMSIPIINLIEHELKLKGGKEENFLASNGELVEVLCYDLIINFASNMAKQASDKVMALKINESESQKIDDFLEKINHVQRTLSGYKHTAYQRALIIMQAKERIAKEDDFFNNQFTRLWGNR